MLRQLQSRGPVGRTVRRRLRARRRRRTASGGRRGRRRRRHLLNVRVGRVLLTAGVAVGQLEPAGVRVLAVGVGAGALVVAQAQRLVAKLGR